MAATKVMKFWAVCLVMLGKLLASLGVSAAASAARRDAALYERTLGKGNAGTEAPGGDAPDVGRCSAPDHQPERGSRAVPAPRTVPLYGQAGPARRMFPRPELPPTIKQRISAEAHGTSPGMRSRITSGAEPLTADDFTDPAGTTPDAGRADADARSDVIPAARNRAHTARVV
ncbi:DUF6344 domain-containing protein [Streptomyces sp. C10]|uniref:DUF6344 domain-containing protein n=1 Tax=Streptomyces sp. C10 TaxID=531941 RepID=UPI00397F1BFB